MDDMFRNPGKKIKTLSIILFYINCVVSLIGSFALSNSLFGFDFFSFLFALAGGLLVSFVLSLFLYGFGELIENSAKSDATKRAEELQAAQPQTVSPQSAESQQTTQLQTDADPASHPLPDSETQKQLPDEGEITQEEINQTTADTLAPSQDEQTYY